MTGSMGMRFNVCREITPAICYFVLPPGYYGIIKRRNNATNPLTILAP